MPQLPRPRRKRKHSNAGTVSPSRKRIKHVTKRRLSQIYNTNEDDVETRSQELMDKVKEISQKDLSEREALNLLRENDLDVEKAATEFLTNSQNVDKADEVEAQDEEEDSLADKVIPDKKKKAIVQIEDSEDNGEEDDEKEDQMDEEPADPFADEESVEPSPGEAEEEAREIPDSENEAKQRGLTHYLSAKFTQNALAVFKDCVMVVSKIQEGNDAMVMKIDSKEKKVKFWCRSSGYKNDVLEFVFENGANPRCFREFHYFSDQDITMEADSFELAVQLKNLQMVAKKINVKKHVLTMDIHNSSVAGKSIVRFKFESLDDSTRFEFNLKKIDINAADPMLSQFHSVRESQVTQSTQELNKSVHEEDALVTLWTSTVKFKEAHSMFKGISNVISFQIHRMRPDTEELSEAPDDEKFEVRLKSKGSEGDIVSKTRLPLRGGPNLKSIHVKKGKDIKENINVDLPTDMVGKILNLKFIHKIVKIDFYEVDKVRFIFRFALSKCQGRLYYNVDPYPEYVDPDLEELRVLDASEAVEGQSFVESEAAEDPLKESELLDDSMPPPKGKSPRRKQRKKKRLRNSLSAQIDVLDEDVNE